MSRPIVHFTPPQGWINDPNGLVFHRGYYHLFYQYYPDGLVWGPMHWGHAVSRDFIHWEHWPMALTPDEEGAIFSGSAVDEGDILTVCYTYNHPEKGQRQALARSYDGGLTFEKLGVVLTEPELRDFRDPKLFWYAPMDRWVMVLSAGDHIRIYTSRDKKSWTHTDSADFPGITGVRECPDLFPLPVSGGVRWVLLASIAVPAGEERFGTVYRVGDFDGERFIADDEPRWLDGGLDNYAAITFSGMEDRRVLLGWMNCWHYANQIPEDGYRGSMTIPRELSLKVTGGGYRLLQQPVSELTGPIIAREESRSGRFAMSVPSPCFSVTGSFAPGTILTLGSGGEQVTVTLDGNMTLDRTHSGAVDFSPYFTPVFSVPLEGDGPVDLRLVADRQSVELFAGEGEAVITAQVFPGEPYDTLTIETAGVSRLELTGHR